jgi:hypothetical protein
MEPWSDGVMNGRDGRAPAIQHSDTLLFQFFMLRFILLALALLVPGVGADHTDNAFALDNLAILAKLFD